jgi:hypothetical protein
VYTDRRTRLIAKTLSLSPRLGRWYLDSSVRRARRKQ